MITCGRLRQQLSDLEESMAELKRDIDSYSGLIRKHSLPESGRDPRRA